MRDSLEGVGSLEANAHSILQTLLVIPLKMYAIWRAKSLGFGDVEIKSLIKKGATKPLQNCGE